MVTSIGPIGMAIMTSNMTKWKNPSNNYHAWNNPNGMVIGITMVIIISHFLMVTNDWFGMFYHVLPTLHSYHVIMKDLGVQPWVEDTRRSSSRVGRALAEIQLLKRHSS